MPSLLAADIPLPPHPVILVLCLVPTLSGPSTPDVFHAARRRLPTPKTLLDPFLYSVQLGHRPALYLFSLVSEFSAHTATSALDDLSFDGLTAPSSAVCFPFQDIHRHLLSHFLSALRTRLINAIVVSSASAVHPSARGFFISHSSHDHDDWGSSWQYKARSRPLVFCHIQLLPTTHSILVRPSLFPSPYLPLSSTLPLLPRSPILLLPYCTPAYFLTTYSGPTSALTRHFSDALGHPLSPTSFIIGWISVENRQGEDKGISFVYPATLCLAFVPALNRPLLHHTPDLPGPLQPSPKLLSASTPLSDSPPTYPYRPSLLGSPSAQLEAFRALSLSKSKNIHAVAAQVSNYVDQVAKDRERERERLKREREGATAHSPSLLARTMVTTVSNPHIPSSSTTPLPPVTVHTPTPAPSTQNFYPSPPQADITTTAAIIATVPPRTGNTSPVLPAASRPSSSQCASPRVTTTTPTQAPPLTSSSSSSSYDPFGYLAIDMGMDFTMDIGINFGIGIGMNLSENSSSSISTAAAGVNRSAYHDGHHHDGRDGTRGGTHSTMDFEDFTDDDFNFFDQPSSHTTTAPAPPPTSAISLSISNPLQVTSPPLFSDVHLSGPGPPNPTPHAHSTPASHGTWSSIFPEGFTPRSVEHMDSVLVSSTPGPTPLNAINNNVDMGSAVSPNVYLEYDHIQPLQPSPMILDDAGDPLKGFDPIPFATHHRVSDGKYAPSGKFGLPSPPPDEPELPPPPPLVILKSLTGRKRSPSVRCTFDKKVRRGLLSATTSTTTTTTTTGWRPRYDAITDPRVGMMRKLIGVKRKHPIQGGRAMSKEPRISLWTEEWTVHRSSTSEGKDVESEHSEDEGSQSEDGISEEGEADGEEEKTSRPSTPTPSYLPIGPSLIHTHFIHSYLLSISKPLRPPGSSIINISASGSSGTHGSGSGNGNMAVTPTATAANVPTPVSPAAGLGLVAEKWRAFEVVVNILTKEAVENWLWCDTWMACNAFGSGSNTNSGGQGNRNGGGGMEGKRLTEVWVSDVRFVEKVFAVLEGGGTGVQAGLDAVDILGSDTPSGNKTLSPQILTTPKITVGKGEAVINILPPALRFWEKLGLGPKNGGKDGTMFALFSDEGIEPRHRHAEVTAWLSGVCTAYETKHLGKLKLGTFPSFGIKDGLVPLRFDHTFRKSFVTFVSNLSGISPAPILLFLVVPTTFMSLSSTIFRQILSTMHKILKTLPENPTIVHLIPEHAINYIESDPACATHLESFCINLYDRIPIPVEQPLARIFSPDSTPISVKAYLQKPIFTLARPTNNRVTYTRSVHASLGVVDRYTMIHVGYKMSECGKWVLAACVDQRGEAWDQAVWLVKSDQQDGECEGTNPSTGTGGHLGGDVTPGSNSGGMSTPAGGGGGCVNPEQVFAVKKVWEFVASFARKADVEWRIVISKLGTMEEAELAAWTTFLPLAMPTSNLGSVHVSVICVDPDSPWLFTKFGTDSHLHCSFPLQFGINASDSTNSKSSSPPSPHTSSSRQNFFSDNSSTTYAFFPGVTLPIPTPPTRMDLGLDLPYVGDPTSVNGSSLGDADSDNGGVGGDTGLLASSSARTAVPTVVTPTSPASSTCPAEGSTPHPVGLIPKATSCLVRVPRAAPLTLISMLHIHILWTYCYPLSLVKRPCASALELKTVHADVTRNFYELSVLAKTKWRMAESEAGNCTGTPASCRGGISGPCSAGSSRTGVNPILPIHLAMVDVMNRVTDGADGVEIES